MRKIKSLIVLIAAFSPAVQAQAGDDEKAVRQFGNEIRELEVKSKDLSPQDIVIEADGILSRLGENSSEENKPLVETVKLETSKFYQELADYDLYLNKVADPSFFNFEKASDPGELSRQIDISAEYLQRSKKILQYAESFPNKMRLALERKQFPRDTVNSVLKGLEDAEAGMKSSPRYVLGLRVQHAVILNSGLNWLKSNQGNWQYDTKEGLLGFQDPELSNYWETQVIAPLLDIENKINEVLLAPRQLKNAQP